MKVTKQEDAFSLKLSKKIKAVNKLGKKCKRCGIDDFIVLEFHHIDGKTKNVSSLLSYRWSKIEEEIKKCILLCSNCHSEEHGQGSRNSKIKKEICIDRSLTKCSKCKYSGDNFASLEFHHKNPEEKLFNISNAICRSENVSIQQLEEELNKCIVLCSNCHRKEHFDYEKFKKLKSTIEKKIKLHKETRPKIDRDMVLQKILNGSRQIDIVKELGCSKGTISDIVKSLRKEGKL